MANPVPLPPPGFDDLSVDEKIDYVQSLWDRIAATPETIPVPEWHREILDERLKDLEANPNAGESWEIVQQRLQKKFDTATERRWHAGSSFAHSPRRTSIPPRNGTRASAKNSPPAS